MTTAKVTIYQGLLKTMRNCSYFCQSAILYFLTALQYHLRVRFNEDHERYQHILVFVLVIRVLKRVRFFSYIKLRIKPFQHFFSQYLCLSVDEVSPRFAGLESSQSLCDIVRDQILFQSGLSRCYRHQMLNMHCLSIYPCKASSFTELFYLILHHSLYYQAATSSLLQYA